MVDSSAPLNHSARKLATGLGLFSLALGVAELVAPGTIKRNVGTPGSKGLLQAFGAREIAAGLVILTSDRPVSMVWGRVAGDLIDLATLLPAVSKSNPSHTGGAAAFGFVALVTAVDLCVALQGDHVSGGPELAGVHARRSEPSSA
jgi:hypothetical protein